MVYRRDARPVSTEGSEQTSSPSLLTRVPAGKPAGAEPARRRECARRTRCRLKVGMIKLKWSRAAHSDLSEPHKPVRGRAAHPASPQLRRPLGTREERLLFHPIYSYDVVFGETFASFSDGFIFR